MPVNAGDMGLIPGWGRSPGEGNGNSLLLSCHLGNPMDRGACRAIVHGSQRVGHDFKQQKSIHKVLKCFQILNH